MYKYIHLIYMSEFPDAQTPKDKIFILKHTLHKIS